MSDNVGYISVSLKPFTFILVVAKIFVGDWPQLDVSSLAFVVDTIVAKYPNHDIRIPSWMR